MPTDEYLDEPSRPTAVKAAAPEAKAAPPPTREPLRHDPNRDISEYIEEEESDRLKIAKSDYPDGFDLQWVTRSVWGRPESQLLGRFQRKGWKSVLPGEFEGKYDHFVAAGHEGDIEVDGLVLMARPKTWSDRAKALDDRAAIEKVQIKTQQLTGGEVDGVKFDTQHPSARAVSRVNRSYETIAVPPDRKG